MIIEFDKSFEKSLNKIKDKSLFDKLEKVIAAIDEANNVLEVSNIKKLTGFNNSYRIRIWQLSDRD